MNNYKLIIQYKGTNYSGWQIQKNEPTIQQLISNSIYTILKEEVNLIGAGRTDTGVHALGQTANFRTKTEIDIFRFRYSLNSILPQDISVIKMEKTDIDFHARYDAKKRSYIYLISDYKSPFYYDYSYYLYFQFDVKKINLLSKNLLGENDFSSFCRTQTETENKICNIYSLNCRYVKGLTVFYIEADRFLHGMVRTIVGSLISAAKKNYDEEYLKQIISAKNRESAGEAVPAKGLFLYKIKY